MSAPIVRWDRSTRAELGELLPEAVVAVPTGATEQHGPHLATGTDALLATTVLERAAQLYDGPRPLVLAPTMPFGASDHHLPFGGTLSLSPETLTAVLVDLGRSLAADGGSRLMIVNGHGGNTGVCQAAAAAISNRHDVTVGYLDYWSLLAGDEEVAAALPKDAVPGHAGAFESSLVAAVDPALVRDAPTREEYRPNVPVAGLQVHASSVWAGWDGFTDSPGAGSADLGADVLGRLGTALAAKLTAFATSV